jgi:hypothetical protein
MESHMATRNLKPKSKSSKCRASRSVLKAGKRIMAPRPAEKSGPKATGASAGSSKQETVLGLLRQSKGTTIEAIMKVTNWQQHSVRGFLAGVVKKKLKLNLTSQKVDGKRIYCIGKSGAQT